MSSDESSIDSKSITAYDHHTTIGQALATVNATASAKQHSTIHDDDSNEIVVLKLESALNENAMLKLNNVVLQQQLQNKDDMISKMTTLMIRRESEQSDISDDTNYPSPPVFGSSSNTDEESCET